MLYVCDFCWNLRSRAKSRYQRGVVVVSARASAAALTATMATPGGAIQPFCEPVMRTSICQPSVSNGMQPAPLTESTASSLPRPLTTAAIAGRSLVTPVLVSLWVTKTVVTSGCSARMRSTSSGSIGSPGPTRNRSTSAPYAVAMSAQRSPKEPTEQKSACSPGLSRLTTAASRPPVPLHGKISTSLSVRSAQRSPSSMSRSSAANSGPRWLIIGRLAARTTRSGSGVGPGTRSCCANAMSAPSVHVDVCQKSTKRPVPTRRARVARRLRKARRTRGGDGRNAARARPESGPPRHGAGGVWRCGAPPRGRWHCAPGAGRRVP